MVPEVQTVVSQIEGERGRFERFCTSLTDEELRREVPESTWQVKDFISHLATIDGPVAGWFVAIQSGNAGGPAGRTGEAWNVDRYNDGAVAKRRDRSVEEILAEARAERAAMIEVLGRFSEEQVSGTIRFGGDSKRPPSDLQLLRYLQGWARHDIIHIADMLKALPERRNDAVITEWLAEPGVEELIGFYQRAMR
ncbi:MAG: DinB family protein [Dehalococcoidia bacterium]